MKLRDAGSPVASLKRPLVVMDDLGQVYDFRELESGSQLASRFEGILPADLDGIVFVGAPPTEECGNLGAFCNGTIVQFWMPLNVGYDAERFFRQQGELEVVALSVEENWVKVQVKPSSDARPIDDLLTGIRVGSALAGGESQPEPEVEEVEGKPGHDEGTISLRAEILTRLKGRPLKRYLPQWAVHRIYVLIGSLR